MFFKHHTVKFKPVRSLPCDGIGTGPLGKEVMGQEQEIRREGKFL